jgi:hypothetical protein
LFRRDLGSRREIFEPIEDPSSLDDETLDRT